MGRRALRVVPLLAAAVLLGLLGAGSLALAHGGHHTHDGPGGDDTAEHHSHDGCGNDHKAYSAWDEQWLMMSIEGDLFEIQGGKLAQSQGTTDEVRALGARLVTDHGKSLQDATDLANSLGIEVPDSPSPSQQWELRVVSSFSGVAFDRWYADLEVQDHMQDIQEAQDEVDKGCNPDIRKDAANEIPTLQEHLRVAQEALKAAGGRS
jgi:putative membrane protein